MRAHRAVWRRGRVTTLPLAVAELRRLVAQHQLSRPETEKRTLLVSALTPLQLAASQQIETVLRGPMAMELLEGAG